MKRVLFVSYFFPPIGGAGVQRSAKFVRYLPELGWEPIVLTGPGLSTDRWTPADESLERDVPPGTRVLRVPGPVPARTTGARARRERWLRTSTTFSRWWQEGIRSIGREAGDVDLVYVSMSPFESAPAVAQLAHAIARPWIADLRDPWALDEMTVYPSALHRRLELRRMDRVLSSAAAVIANTPEAAHALAGLGGLRTVPTVAIPNGYDASDFAAPPPPARADGIFRIVHAGYLHTALGRGQQRAGTFRRLLAGDQADVDHLTRSHVFLLRALERLLQARPELDGRVELQLAGVLTPADHAAIDEELRRPGIVRTPGYLTHAETIELIRGADLLFLPMHGLPRGRRARIVPGKTYEYLATGRPILAAVPDGDARELLGRAGAVLAWPDDVGAMTSALAQAVDGELPRAAAPPELLERFERRTLTGELADVFESAVARRPIRRAAEPAAAPS